MDALQLNRRRLLALTGSSMVLVSLSGCGGGEDAAAAPATAGPDPTPTPPPPAPPPPPPPPPTGASDFDGNGAAAAGSAGTPVSAAQRVAALDAVTAAMSSLASTAGGGPQRDAVALARQLQLMPAFHRVGISTRMGNVWARFTDGRSLVPGGRSGAQSFLLRSTAASGWIERSSPPLLLLSGQPVAVAMERPSRSANRNLENRVMGQERYKRRARGGGDGILGS